jgi:hypothetical protein
MSNIAHLFLYNYVSTFTAHYTTSCIAQSNAPEDGQNNCLNLVALIRIINKQLLLHLVGCLPYYLYQWCTVKQISKFVITFTGLIIKEMCIRSPAGRPRTAEHILNATAVKQ